GERLSVSVTLENTGAETWTAGDYALVNERNGWGAPARLPLPHDVPPGEVVTFTWRTQPLNALGVQHSQWRLAYGGAPFPGAPIVISAVVLSADQAGQRGALQALLRAWRPGAAPDVERALLREEVNPGQ